MAFAVADEALELPEGIIQHIQSFLKSKPAAQTSLLSKSWYKAWSTRPTLSFDHHHFNESLFWDFMTKTVQRYMDLNRKVDKFILTALFDEIHYDEDNDDDENNEEDSKSDDGESQCDVVDASLIDKLIVDALKLRVNVLKLDIVVIYGELYALPFQVFEHKYLTELHLTSCRIVQQNSGRVRCPNLLSLSLLDVDVGDDMFMDILLGCPLIEHLSLSGHLLGLTKFNVSKLHNLKTLNVMILSDFIIFDFDKHRSRFVADVRFLSLSRLVLEQVKIDDSFFTNFSSRFPCLEILTLRDWHGSSDVQISSKSLKRMTLVNCNELVISIRISSHSLKCLTLVYIKELVNLSTFDVPNISKFEVSTSTHFHSLSFIAASNGCRFEINFPIYSSYGASWFSGLKVFLIKLGRSKISIHVTIYGDNSVVPVRNMESFPLPVVDKLTFSFMNLCTFNGCNFIFCFLWSCRPKLVSLTNYHNAKDVQLLYRMLARHKILDGLTTASDQYSSSLCLHDLKEVTVELFEASHRIWKPIKALSGAWKFLNNGVERLRFRLTWGSFEPKHTIVKFG